MRSFDEVLKELVDVQIKLLSSYSDLIQSFVEIDLTKFEAVSPELSQAIADMHRVLTEILVEHKDEIMANRERLSKVINVIGFIAQINADALKIFDEFKL